MGMGMGGVGQETYQTHGDPALAYAEDMRAQAAGWTTQGMNQTHQYRGMGHANSTMEYGWGAGAIL